LMLVPRPYSSCHGVAFRALAMCFVPWRSASCRGNALRAATMFFLPQHCATCHSIVLCAAALFFVPWQCSSCCGKVVACMALFFMSWRETTCCSVAWHSAPSFLRPLAKNDPLLHSVTCLIVLQCCSLCRGQVPRDMVIFFVPREETTRRSIPRRRSSFRGKKRCAAAFRGIADHVTAWCVVPWHCSLCRGHATARRKKTTCVAL